MSTPEIEQADCPSNTICRGTCDRHSPLRARRLIPIPDVVCANCGAGLAWRVGVGRYVISHDNGDDVCSRATARLAPEDRDAASLAFRKADEAYQSEQVCWPESPNQPTAAPSAAGGADGGAGRG